eukprot:TRINITY_DN27815_c0_g1_i1.p1 TRINITY_DN27815_c0_g1~~TRINITY_DN27815_c0_g1_i1.p1  ORF type:complete len:149 (+),score=21.11 TRINITY_DN27815_c0_g1_i1:176-622(+)
MPPTPCAGVSEHCFKASRREENDRRRLEELDRRQQLARAAEHEARERDHSVQLLGEHLAAARWLQDRVALLDRGPYHPLPDTTPPPPQPLRHESRAEEFERRRREELERRRIVAEAAQLPPQPPRPLVGPCGATGLGTADAGVSARLV